MRAAFDIGLARRLADHWGHQGGVPVRAEDEDEARESDAVEARSDGATAGARFHAAAKVREGLVGARGIAPSCLTQVR
jgi:hypothetical protein